MKVRHVPIVVQAIYTGVSIHAPVKVRLNVRPEEIKTCIVSIHAPVKDKIFTERSGSVRVSIHAPVKVRPDSHKITQDFNGFQFTHL